MTVYSQPHGDFCSFCRPFSCDQEHQAHADNLLCYLGKGGNPGFLGTIAVAVGAGVERGKGQGKTHNRQIGTAAGLHKNACCDPVLLMTDQESENAGEYHGNIETGAKDPAALTLVGSYVLGKGSLDRTAADGKADAVDRMHHIVNAKPLSTDGAREENTVEKAQEAAEKACGREQQRAGEKGALFLGKTGIERHKTAPRPEILLQDMKLPQKSEPAMRAALL